MKLLIRDNIIVIIFQLLILMGIKYLLAQLILSTGIEMEKRSVSGGRVAAQGSYHSYGEWS